MAEKRHSRFDPEYEEENEEIYQDIDDSDDEFDNTPKPRKSRFEDDESSVFGIGKKRQTRLFDKDTGEAFGDFEEDDYDDDDDKPRTPFWIRMSAWVVMVLILFVVGYYAANYITDYADKRSIEKPSDTTAPADTAKDTKGKSDSETQEVSGPESMTTATYKLYIPSENDFAVRKVEIAKGRTEQDIQKLLEMYFENLQEEGIISSTAPITDVFKSDNLLYINTDTDFEKLIQPLDETTATKVITGMLSTLWNNFSIKKVQFYINTQKSEMRQPVDLSAEWSL